MWAGAEARLRFSRWPGNLAPEAPRPHPANLLPIINLVDYMCQP